MVAAMTDFKEVIGQNKAKRRLGFLLNSFKKTQVIPPIMFTASKGQGKTLFARSLARHLAKNGQEKVKFVPRNAIEFKNLDDFFDDLIIPHVENKDVTVFIDEASEMPLGATIALLTILETNKENKTSYIHNGMTIDFDLSRISWIFATSEPQKIFAPLMDRFERIDLEENTHEDLKNIIQKNSSVGIDNKVLDEVASISRKSPRVAVSWANKLKNTGKDYIDYPFWKEIRDQFGIVKYGLSSSEFKVLEILKEGSKTLTALAARTDYSRQALQREIEPGLMRHGLIEVGVSGRKLTHKGIEYLKDCQNL